MKHTIHLLIIVITGLLVGCGKSGSSASSSSGSSGVAAAIEGTYISTDNADVSLIIKDGHYQQGSSDIHAEGTFVARKIDDTTFELDVIYSGRLAGEKGTIVIRKQSDGVTEKDKDRPDETQTQFKRK